MEAPGGRLAQPAPPGEPVQLATRRLGVSCLDAHAERRDTSLTMTGSSASCTSSRSFRYSEGRACSSVPGARCGTSSTGCPATCPTATTGTLSVGHGQFVPLGPHFVQLLDQPRTCADDSRVSPGLDRADDQPVCRCRCPAELGELFRSLLGEHCPRASPLACKDHRSAEALQSLSPRRRPHITTTLFACGSGRGTRPEPHACVGCGLRSLVGGQHPQVATAAMAASGGTRGAGLQDLAGLVLSGARC